MRMVKTTVMLIGPNMIIVPKALGKSKTAARFLVTARLVPNQASNDILVW